MWYEKVRNFNTGLLYGDDIVDAKVDIVMGL